MSESQPPSEAQPQAEAQGAERPVMPDVSDLEPVSIRAPERPRDPEPPEERAPSAAPAPAGNAPSGAAGLAKGADGDGELGRVLEIPLTVHVELGRRRMRISELLELQPGSVLELDAEASAPLSIYANRTLVARGEAVVVGGHYGVRITEIVSPEERAMRLGGAGR